jgi:hypothetical protein
MAPILITFWADVVVVVDVFVVVVVDVFVVVVDVCVVVEVALAQALNKNDTISTSARSEMSSLELVNPCFFNSSLLFYLCI